MIKSLGIPSEGNAQGHKVNAVDNCSQSASFMVQINEAGNLDVEALDEIILFSVSVEPDTVCDTAGNCGPGGTVTKTK